jgi:hypothetical protein
MSNNKQYNGFMIAGLIGTIVFGVHLSTSLFSFFFADRNIWWTPSRLALPLSETEDVFQLLITTKPLKDHLEAGTLHIIGPEGGQYKVVDKDITVRLNNWQRIQIQTLEGAVFSAFFFGVCTTLLIIGYANRRKELRAGQGTAAPPA